MRLAVSHVYFPRNRCFEVLRGVLNPMCRVARPLESGVLESNHESFNKGTLFRLCDIQYYRTRCIFLYPSSMDMISFTGRPIRGGQFGHNVSLHTSLFSYFSLFHVVLIVLIQTLMHGNIRPNLSRTSLSDLEISRSSVGQLSRFNSIQIKEPRDEIIDLIVLVCILVSVPWFYLQPMSQGPETRDGVPVE